MYSIPAGTVADSNILENLQKEIAGVYLPYIDEEAVQVLKEIGKGSMHLVSGFHIGFFFCLGGGGGE